MLDHRADDAPLHAAGSLHAAEPSYEPEPSQATEPPHATDTGAAPVLPRIAPAPGPTWPRIRLGGVMVDQVTCLQVVDHVRSGLAVGRGGALLTLDLSSARRQFPAEIRDLAGRCDLVISDEPTSPWARLLHRAARRVDGIPAMPLLWALARTAAAQHQRVLVVGGPAGGAVEVAGILEATIPGLDDVGAHVLARPVDADSGVNADLLVALGGHRPDLVLLSPEVPRQAEAVERLRGLLPAAWVVACGAGAAFVHHDRPRQPAAE